MTQLFDPQGTLLPETPLLDRPDISQYFLWLGLAVFAICAFLLYSMLPVVMDEYITLHRIACEYYPNAHYHVFREGCHLYRMHLGPLSWYHSYAYIGNIQGTLIYPLFFLFHSPWAVYSYSFVMLLIFCLLCVKALKLPGRCALIPAIYFPFLYLMLKDAAPMRLAILALPALILLAAPLSRSDLPVGKALALSLAAGLICVLGFEDKPYFIYTLPMFLTIAAGNALGLTDSLDYQKIRTLDRAVLFRVAIFCALCLALPVAYVCVVQIYYGGGTSSYISYLINLSSHIENGVTAQLKNMLFFLTSPFLYGDLLYPRETETLLLSQALGLSALLLGLVCLYRSGHLLSALSLSFLCIVAVNLVLKNASKSTHYIYLHIPIMLGLMMWAGRSRRAFCLITLVLSVISVISTTQLCRAKPFVHSDLGINAVLSYLSSPQVAEGSVINFTDWGGYYQLSTFGDHNQLAIFLNPFDGNKALQAVKLAQEARRPVILNVCWNCNSAQYSKLYAGLPCQQLDFPGTPWKIIKTTVPPAQQ